MDEETEIQVRFTQLVNNRISNICTCNFKSGTFAKTCFFFFFFASPVPKARFLKGSVMFLTWEKGKKKERKGGRQE